MLAEAQLGEAQLAMGQVVMADPGTEFQRMAVPFPNLRETVFCNWCGLPTETATMRVTAKGAGKVKCKRCCSTFSKMYNEKGKWPTPQFSALSDEVQMDFYAQASTMSLGKDIVKLMENKLEKFKSKEFTWALGGAYLPLNAWKTKGFDDERIKRTTKPEDIQENEQAGTCYRVFSSLETGSEGWKQSQTLSSSSGDNHRNAPATTLAIQPPSETAPEFAARMKLERANRKELEKVVNKKRATAAMLEKKLAGPLERLTSTLASNIAEGNIPTIAKQGAIAMRNQAKEMQTELQAIIENPDAADPDKKHEVRASTIDMGIQIHMRAYA